MCIRDSRHTEHWINRQKNNMQLNAVAYRGSKQIQDFVMNKFYIITNNEKDKNLEFTDRVVDYLCLLYTSRCV